MKFWIIHIQPYRKENCIHLEIIDVKVDIDKKKAF